MVGEYDPLQKRLNPEIKEIIRAAQRTWKDLKKETDPTCLKGYCAIMIAHFEMLRDTPYYLQELADGLQNDTKAWLMPEEFGEHQGIFTSSKPFDSASVRADRFFFYTQTGKVSLLYGPEARDPYLHPQPLHRYGYFVYTLEKKYATPNETSAHVISEQVLSKVLGRSGQSAAQRGGRRFFVLIDPKGFRRGEACHLVKVFSGEPAARKAADRLAGVLNIRFLVAEKVFEFCTH